MKSRCCLKESVVLRHFYLTQNIVFSVTILYVSLNIVLIYSMWSVTNTKYKHNIILSFLIILEPFIPFHRDPFCSDYFTIIQQRYKTRLYLPTTLAVLGVLSTCKLSMHWIQIIGKEYSHKIWSVSWSIWHEVCITNVTIYAFRCLFKSGHLLDLLNRQWPAHHSIHVRVLKFIQFKCSSGRELVILNTILSMFGMFSVHVQSQCGGLNEEHFILVHWGPYSFVKRCYSIYKNYSIFFVQTFTLTSSMHWEFTTHGNFCMQNNQLLNKTLMK